MRLRVVDHADFGRTQDKLLDSVEGAENAPYDPRREAGILRLLNELRGEHSVRYANSKDRQAAQQTRTFRGRRPLTSLLWTAARELRCLNQYPSTRGCSCGPS